jgi:hypothetical protein
MRRAELESKSVKIWRSGTSTMIATNGREFAPGLDDQYFMSRQSERMYMIPAGPRVPPLDHELDSNVMRGVIHMTSQRNLR